MESPVVIDKPPEYHGNNERGFPFDEDEASGAWADLAARHPDIAARLRERPAGWTSKRRPSSQDATDDFDDGFGARFPFQDIPSEFREHFPTHWNRRFQHEEPQQPQRQAQQSSATQTEPPAAPAPGPAAPEPAPPEPERREQRASSAPPAAAMSREPAAAPAPPPASVRHIPIFVEGRDEPVLPRNAADAPPPPAFVPPPPAASDADYFDDDFFPPRNVARAFGVPFASNYRAAPQPFTHTKAFPQAAAARAASPQRDPRAPAQPRPPTAQAHPPPPTAHAHPPSAQPHPPTAQAQHAPPRQPSPPPPKSQPAANDPITQILGIQTDVLNLMSEVENFTGCKKDKRYAYLDEMLTRNLIKLDNIETDGKENIRQARKEAIRCIQKCIAVLEAKAERGAAPPAAAPPAAAPPDEVSGEAEITQAKENSEPETETPMRSASQERSQETTLENSKPDPSLADQTQPQPSDTRPDDRPAANHKDNLENKPQETVEKKSPKKGKTVKKRDKSKDNKETADSSKQENVDNSQVQVDNSKGESQTMEVDGAASQ